MSFRKISVEYCRQQREMSCCLGNAGLSIIHVSRSLENRGFLFCVVLVMLRIKVFCSNNGSGWYSNTVAIRYQLSPKITRRICLVDRVITSLVHQTTPSSSLASQHCPGWLLPCLFPKSSLHLPGPHSRFFLEC